MATIKAYTDIEQSKRLAEILPLKSADMYYSVKDTLHAETLYCPCDEESFKLYNHIPCWNLAALLDVLPNYQLQTQDDGIGILCSCNEKFNIVTADNPVDACVAMIEKLHELNLL